MAALLESSVAPIADERIAIGTMPTAATIARLAAEGVTHVVNCRASAETFLSFDSAARRALHTKAGLDAGHWYLEQLGTFGAPDRDSRGRVVSAAQLALERSDGLSLVPGGGIMRAEWVPVRGLPAESLAFDHADMLRVATNRAQSKLRYSWLAFQLLPETVTLPELRAVYAAILDPALLRLNTGNFKKAFSPLFASGVLVPVGRRASVGRVGRPGDLYRFTGPVMGTWERELPWHDTISGGEAAE